VAVLEDRSVPDRELQAAVPLAEPGDEKAEKRINQT
jgi:hypothetical protein